MRLRTFLCLMLAIFTFANAQSQLYQLKYKYKAGEVRSMKFVMEMKGEMLTDGSDTPMPMDSAYSFITTSKILGIKPNGDTRMLVSIDSMNIKVDGKPLQDASVKVNFPKMKMLFSPDGKMVEKPELIGGDANLRQMMGDSFNTFSNFGVVMPEKPVNIGESWEADLVMPGTTFGPAQNIKFKFTLASVETFKGIEVFKLTGDFTSEFNNTDAPRKDTDFNLSKMVGSSSGRFTYYLSRETGELIYSQGDMESKVKSQYSSSVDDSKPTSMTMTMNSKLIMHRIAQPIKH